MVSEVINEREREGMKEKDEKEIEGLEESE